MNCNTRRIDLIECRNTCAQKVALCSQSKKFLSVSVLPVGNLEDSLLILLVFHNFNQDTFVSASTAAVARTWSLSCVISGLMTLL